MKTILYQPIFINPQAYFVFPQLYHIEKGDSYIEPANITGQLIIQSLSCNTKPTEDNSILLVDSTPILLIDGEPLLLASQNTKQVQYDYTSYKYTNSIDFDRFKGCHKGYSNPYEKKYGVFGFSMSKPNVGVQLENVFISNCKKQNIDLIVKLQPKQFIYINGNENKVKASIVRDIKYFVDKQAQQQTQNTGNVLYGKKYAACGDSFTEAIFQNIQDESGLTGKDSPELWDAHMKNNILGSIIYFLTTLLLNINTSLLMLFIKENSDRCHYYNGKWNKKDLAIGISSIVLGSIAKYFITLI